MALNPIRFAGQVNEQFRRYQLTAFPIADPDLALQAQRLLGTGAFGASPLVRGPYLSVARAFELGDRLEDLATAGVIHPALAGVAEHPVLFRHQQETLEAVRAGRHVLVSTGTGSGKTESFLYPIIDRCLRLRDEDAAQGVVAVLVYPMNALASDQRDRLRSLLTGTGITFGLYVGSTPRRRGDTTVFRLEQGADRVAYELERRRRLKENVAVSPFEECVSEEEIAERKPRLLLTNANQLEILLTRGRDLGLFTDAPLQFLVLDEAHTYSGATGAEVACLMRRVRAFAGKSVDDVTCIVTSATIVDPEQGNEVGPAFLGRLFGVPDERVALVNERYALSAWPERRVIPPAPADPIGALDAVLAALGTGPDDIDPDSLSTAVERLTGSTFRPAGPLAEALFRELAANEIIRVMAEELVHPLALDEAVIEVWKRLARRTAPPAEAGAELLAYLALAALAESDGAPLLRPKMHVFVRGLEGASIVFEGDDSTPTLYGSAEAALAASPGRLPGAIFPVWVCRTCGQHYFETWLDDFAIDRGRPVGGEAIGERSVWRPVGEDAGTQVRFTNRFLAELGEDDDDDGPSAATQRLDARRVGMHVCRHCGTFHASAETCANPACTRPGSLAAVYVVIEDKGFRCPGCGAGSQRIGDRRVEPIRPLRAVTVTDVHILAQEMINAAPTDEERHLLVFADNRQDAAFQAGWMRDHARRYRLRHLMLEAVRTGSGPSSVGDVHAALNSRLQGDRELARALAPEAFSSEADEAFGGAQRHNLGRFLRIQILRELAAAMSQRESLERWGQLRIVYAGITADDPDVKSLAASVGMDAATLADGIASLLDTWRRNGFLYDADEPVFSRYWRGGDEEILRGFIPFGFSERPPKGVKLTREAENKTIYVQQVLSERGRTAAVDFVARWGIKDPKPVLESIWSLVVTRGVVAPVVLTGANGNAVSGAGGVRQVTTANLGLIAQHERYRCTTCQRVHARPAPKGACTRLRCPGPVVREEPPAEDYNVALLDRPFTMVLAEEHTAQVRADERERIEREFKKPTGRVNTLVATPTLELGVDIGALDLVLLRNVPPTPANYWQRVGRAGRRRRMAVIFTYCRRAIHDTYFFADPHRLLGAPIRPPRFNMKNDVLVAKHTRATVLSELLRRKRDGRLDEAETAALDRAFPTYVRDWLYEGPRRFYRPRSADVLALGWVIAAHRSELLPAVERVFARGWPTEAADEVAPERIEKLVDGMADDLQRLVDRLHERMHWTVRALQRLTQEASLRALDQEEEGQLARCRDFLRRMADERPDTYTLTVLATFGFLPGYGIYEGAISAFPAASGRRDFELSRPPAIALREFVPGNMLYANRRRFRAARYHLPHTEDASLIERYLVEPEAGRVRFASGVASGYAAADAADLEAFPISDVDLAHLGPIRDEELERFQLPVLVLGMPRNERRGGIAYSISGKPLQHLFGEGLRLVNVGPSGRALKGTLGYPVCSVCGATRSPYSSDAELTNFAERHRDRCGRPPGMFGFTADATVDALHFVRLAKREDAGNLGEALRVGASQVLEMEPEDLQTLIVPDGDGGFSLYLYDPMPGGSGLLRQILERWGEIVAVLRILLTACACETSCYQCLRTGRNVYWHRVLDRHSALDLVEQWAEDPVQDYDIPPQATAGTSQVGTHDVEDRFARLLERAGLGGFAAQEPIELGPPYGATVPDFLYLDEALGCYVAVYLDGLSKGLHGDPNHARRDAIIRGQLEDRDWTVVELASSHLDDPELLILDLKKIARSVGGRELAAKVGEDRSWLEESVATIETAETDPASVLDLLAGEARALVEAVVDAGAPVPDVGHEVGDGWPVEAAWPQARVAIVVDSHEERDPWLAAHDWVVASPGEEAAGLAEMIRTRG